MVLQTPVIPSSGEGDETVEVSGRAAEGMTYAIGMQLAANEQDFVRLATIASVRAPDIVVLQDGGHGLLYESELNDYIPFHSMGWMWEADGWRSPFSRTALEALAYPEGTSVPLLVDPLFIAYRKSLLSALRLTAPETFGELLTVSRVMWQVGLLPLLLEVLPLSDEGMGSMNWDARSKYDAFGAWGDYVTVRLYGLEAYEELLRGEMSLQDPRLVTTVELLRTLQSDTGIPLWQTVSSDTDHPFTSGEAAMMLLTATRLEAILESSTENVLHDVGVVPFPHISASLLATLVEGGFEVSAELEAAVASVDPANKDVVLVTDASLAMPLMGGHNTYARALVGAMLNSSAAETLQNSVPHLLMPWTDMPSTFARGTHAALLASMLSTGDGDALMPVLRRPSSRGLPTLLLQESWIRMYRDHVNTSSYPEQLAMFEGLRALHRGRCAAPRLTPAAGEYPSAPLTVSVAAVSPGSVVHVEISGRDPDASSMRCEQCALVLDKPGVYHVHARAGVPHHTPSEVVRMTYVIGGEDEDDVYLAAMIVGGVITVGAVVGLAVLCVASVWVYRKRKRSAALRRCREGTVIDFGEVGLHRQVGTWHLGVIHDGLWRGTHVRVYRLAALNSALPGIAPEDKREARGRGCWGRQGSGAHGRGSTRSAVERVKDLAMLRHPHVAILLGVSETPLAVLSEYVPHGTLHEVLAQKSMNIHPTLKYRWARDIAQGMYFLHDNGVLHGSLQSHTVGLDANWGIKLMSFGLMELTRTIHQRGGEIHHGNRKDGGHRVHSGIGDGAPSSALPWLAPERLGTPLVATVEADVYAYGIVLWEIVSERELYKGLTSYRVALGIMEGSLRPEIRLEDTSLAQGTLDVDLTPVMMKAWAVDPGSRPTFAHILEILDDTYTLPTDHPLIAPVSKTEPTGRLVSVMVQIRGISDGLGAIPHKYGTALRVTHSLILEGVQMYRGYIWYHDVMRCFIVFSKMTMAAQFLVHMEEKMYNAKWPRDVLDLPSCVPLANRDGLVALRGPRISCVAVAGQADLVHVNTARKKQDSQRSNADRTPRAPRSTHKRSVDPALGFLNQTAGGASMRPTSAASGSPRSNLSTSRSQDEKLTHGRVIYQGEAITRTARLLRVCHPGQTLMGKDFASAVADTIQDLHFQLEVVRMRHIPLGSGRGPLAGGLPPRADGAGARMSQSEAMTTQSAGTRTKLVVMQLLAMARIKTFEPIPQLPNDSSSLVTATPHINVSAPASAMTPATPATSPGVPTAHDSNAAPASEMASSMSALDTGAGVGLGFPPPRHSGRVTPTSPDLPPGLPVGPRPRRALGGLPPRSGGNSTRSSPGHSPGQGPAAGGRPAGADWLAMSGARTSASLAVARRGRRGTDAAPVQPPTPTHGRGVATQSLGAPWLLEALPANLWKTRYAFGTHTESYRKTWNDQDVLFKRLVNNSDDVNRDITFAVSMAQFRGIVHPNLLPLVAFCPFPPWSYFVVPFVSTGSLYDCVHTTPGGERQLTIAERVRITKGVADALHYLHEREIVHGGLSPSNVLLTKDKTPLVSDYGLASLSPSKSQSRRTVSYDAPEIISGDRPSKSSDVYAFGMLLLELSTGADPFQGMQPFEVVKQISGGFRPPIPETVNYDVISLILSCWRINPSARPSMSQVVQILEGITDI